MIYVKIKHNLGEAILPIGSFELRHAINSQTGAEKYWVSSVYYDDIGYEVKKEEYDKIVEILDYNS